MKNTIMDLLDSIPEALIEDAIVEFETTRAEFDRLPRRVQFLMAFGDSFFWTNGIWELYYGGDSDRDFPKAKGVLRFNGNTYTFDGEESVIIRMENGSMHEFNGTIPNAIRFAEKEPKTIEVELK